MSVARTIAKVLWELGRTAAKFTRKTAPGREPHYYPAFPEMLTPPLRPGQCFHCGRRFAAPYPVRGCVKR